LQLVATRLKVSSSIKPLQAIQVFSDKVKGDYEKTSWHRVSIDWTCLHESSEETLADVKDISTDTSALI
jgi:hypothetical protein